MTSFLFSSRNLGHENIYIIRIISHSHTHSLCFIHAHFNLVSFLLFYLTLSLLSIRLYRLSLIIMYISLFYFISYSPSLFSIFFRSRFLYTFSFSLYLFSTSIVFLFPLHSVLLFRLYSPFSLFLTFFSSLSFLHTLSISFPFREFE